MQSILIYLLINIFITSDISPDSKNPNWGFHAHKIINRMAVFILPPEMMVFFKANIEYLAEHSTDPDKRRFSVKGEAVKHYMDIDHWGNYPYENMPAHYIDALCKYLEIYKITSKGDSIQIDNPLSMKYADSIFFENKVVLYEELRRFVKTKFPQKVEKTTWLFPSDSLQKHLFKDTITGLSDHYLFVDKFSQHGIAPYNIYLQYFRLREAFKSRDYKGILRISADLGHYVADSHVPLHATRNYNGQLSNQSGIHAFWESRLPELFAEEQYAYFVGKARYIEDIPTYFLSVIKESNRLHYQVLDTEKRIAEVLPGDQLYSYEYRLGRSVRVRSKAFSKTFHEALEGMVEQRMQDAVLALGSLWFTAWVDAGQPILKDSIDLHWTHEDFQEIQSLNHNHLQGKALGRDCK